MNLKSMFTSGLMTCALLLSSSLAASCFCQTQCEPCGESHWRFGADWLYWTGRIDNAVIGAAEKVTTSPTADRGVTETTVKGKNLDLRFKYQDGYRIRAGYDMPCNWSFDVTWSAAHGKGHTRHFVAEPATATTSEVVAFNVVDFPFLSVLAGKGITARELQGRYHILAEAINIDATRSISLTKNVVFLPHIGFRGCWNKQKYSYKGFLTPTVPNSTARFFGDVAERYSGFGVEGGFWVNWNIGYGFTLTGHVGGAILLSTIKIKSKLHTFLKPGVLPEVPTLDLTIKTDSQTGVPMYDLFLGLIYTYPLCNMSFNARIGYEQHVQMFSSHNLSFEGLTLGFNATF